MLAPGATLGRVELRSLLGRGGMGEVWRAYDPRLGREVALKVLPPQLAAYPESVPRFEREARALAALNHPQVAQIYEVGEETPSRVAGLSPIDNRPLRFLVMELVEGESLAARVRRQPLAIEESLRLAAELSRTVAAVHARGVVHRDLKPGNIVLTPDNSHQVLDFGLARLRRPPAQQPYADITEVLSDSGVVVGTAAYMAPEQIRGEDCDERCDVWALGCCLGELLGGRRLFDGATVPEITARVLAARPDLSGLPPDTPAAVRKLLDECFSLERDKRPAMDEVAARLEGMLTPQARRTSRVPFAARWLVGGAAVLVVAGAGLWVAFGPGRAGRAETPGAGLRVVVGEIKARSLPVRLAGLRGQVSGELLGVLGARRSLEVAERGRGGVGVRGLVTGEGAKVRLRLTATDSGSGVVVAFCEQDLDPERPQEGAAAAAQALADALELEAVCREVGREDPLHGFLVRRTSILSAARVFQEGVGYYTRTRFGDAETSLRRALATDPAFWPALLYRAQAAGATSHFGEGRAFLAQGRALHPQPDAIEAAVFEVADALLADDSHRLLEALERARKSFPTSGELTYRTAWAYRGLDQPERAIPLLEALLAQGWQPDWSPTREQLALGQLLVGRTEAALATAAAGEERFPQRYGYALTAAHAFHQLGQTAESRQALARAIRKRTDFGQADPLTVHQVAQWWAASIRWPEEVERQWLAVLEEAGRQLREHPGNAELLQASAEALNGLGRHAEARAALEPLVAGGTELPYVYLALARARFRAGAAADARAALARAEELWRRGQTPGLGNLAYNIGCAWLFVSERENGLGWLLRARDQGGIDRLDLALDPELDVLRQAGLLAQLAKP
ncbi:MAG: protein kinase [Acidobacteriota bacterium]